MIDKIMLSDCFDKKIITIQIQKYPMKEVFYSGVHQHEAIFFNTSSIATSNTFFVSRMYFLLTVFILCQ